ncbi:DUF4178 domain-containing protein [Corynebacterium hylobatis]|uniref:DUF4178 domain-containing protein n=1 Tax=Corynebacterium hylobatis TaxID=1859290 RepID=UPI0013E00F88|nr:DUF4178 domain-containing protein [Corynebacterium hylobatis]
MDAGTIWWLVALLAAAAAVIFLLLGMRARRAGDGGTEHRSRKDPFADVTGARDFGPDVLAPGAIITYGGIDYVVRGSVTVTEGYYTWYEHMLEGGRGSEWLSVEVDEGQLKLSWWISRPDLHLEPVQQLSVEGTDYHLVERGRAEFRTEGEAGLPPQGEVRYHDMAAIGRGGGLLGLESFGGGRWEASLGHTVLPGELSVYPAPKP